MNINEVRLNTHQLHFEQLVFQGKEGLNELNGYIESYINKDGKINKSVKIDGAPAVVVWSKFPGHADNSICLKSFVNGNKNDITSLEDLNKYDERPRMKEMLIHCLELAKYIPEGQAWQGDCLFVKDTLKEREIDGKTYLTFQPNKIIYAFDKGADYDRIMTADFGIAFHTVYYPSRDGIRQGFKVDATKIDAPEKFYIMSPAITPKMSDENDNTDEIKRLYGKLISLESKLTNDQAYEDLCNNEAFMKYWNTFENANLSDKKATNLDIYTFYGDLVQYVNDKMKKEYDTKVSKLKTDKGKAAAEEHYQTALLELQYTLEQNKKLLSTLVETLNCAADIKMEMWKALKDSELGYSTYYQKKTGEYEKGHSEGVAMSDQDGNIIKIVDRSQFSNINRSDEYTSGFNHNESLVYNESKISYNNIMESNKDKIIIRAYIESNVDEKLPTGKLEDIYDEQILEDWFDFAATVEGIIERHGETINVNISKNPKSISEYIDFYTLDSNGNKQPGMIDLRLSNHTQTTNAREVRKRRAGRLDKDFKLKSVTVNNKTFSSYDEAIDHIRDMFNLRFDHNESLVYNESNLYYNNYMDDDKLQQLSQRLIDSLPVKEVSEEDLEDWD